MLTFLASVLTTLAIVLGGPSQVAVDAPVSPVQQQVQQAPAANPILLSDAWQTIDDYQIDASGSKVPLSLDYVTSYAEDPKGILFAGYFAVASIDLPNTYHVFRWSEIHTA